MKGVKQIGKYTFKDGITVRFFHNLYFDIFLYTVNGNGIIMTDERMEDIKRYALGVIEKIEAKHYAHGIKMAS